MAATEIDTPDFLHSKKDEREDYGLSSEILEEKVAEFSGNKVKQLEVAETVNTELETESETFFQALSVPIVSADEGTTESCKAATTEDQEERKSTKIQEAFTEEKPFHDQSVQIVASKEETEEDKSITSQEDQREQKTEESVTKSVESCSEIKQEEDTEEIKPSVEPDEKKDAIRSDDCIAVKTEPQIESDDGIKDTTFEGGLQEKSYHTEGNKAKAVKTTEHIEDDVEETTFQHATTVAYYEEEQILNATPRDIPKEEEVEDIRIDSQEASEKCENRAKDEREQEAEESVDKFAQTSSEIEQKEDTEEIKPSVETEEKTELTTDDSITSQTESHVVSAEHEIKNDEAIQSEETGLQKVEYKEEVKHSDSSLTEIKSESPKVKEVSEETVSEKDGYEEGLKLSNNSNIALKENEIGSKVEDEEKEQEDKSSDAQEASEQYENESKDKIEQNTSSSVETKENEDEEAVLKDEPEEVQKEFEGFSKTSNENEIVSKEENQEKEQELKMSKEVQGGGDDVTSSQNASSEDIKETLIGQQETPVANIEFEEQDQSVITKEIIREEAEDKSSDAQEASEECENGAKEEREQKSEENVNKIVDEETSSEKVEYEEEVKHSDSSNVEINEKTLPNLSKDEDLEWKQEGNTLEKDQGEDPVTSSQDATYEGDLKEKEHHSEGNEPEVVKTKESIGEDTEEIRTSEETILEKVESEEGLQFYDSSNIALNENEITYEEKEQEVHVSGKGQGDEDDVTSSQDATCEDIKETTIGEHVTKVAYFEEGQALISMPKEILKEEPEDKPSDAQEASEKCDDRTEDKREQKPEEIVNKSVKSSSETEQEEDTEDIKPSVEMEQQVCEEAGSEKIEYKEEGKYSESSNTENMVKEVCEETVSEKVESEEGLKLSDSVIIGMNENEIASKVEDEEKEQEVYVSGKGLGDDVTSSQDATFEDIKETTIGEHVTTVAYLEEGGALNSTPKEILKEEPKDKSSDAQEASEQYESGANEKIEQKPEESVDKIENTKEIKPSVEIDEKEQVKITDDEEDVIEVCEVTHLDKGKFEGVEPSDNDKDQEKEKEQESISEEGQGKDDVTCSQDATSIEDLPETKYDEGKEPEFVKPRESIEEDTEEIKSSVDTKDDIKIDEEAIVNDDGQTDKSESLLVKEVSEVTESEKAESELNENEIVSKEENQEKEQELKMSEVQGGGDDVTSSQNASSEDIKETIIGQRTTSVANIEFEEQNQSAINAQEDKTEQKPDVSDCKTVQSCSEIEQEEDIKEIKPSVETEQQELLHDDCITSQTESQVESEEHEVKSDEPIQRDDGQKENVDSSPVNEVCEETSSEKVEYSEEVKETTNEKEIVSKVEDEEKEQEVYVSGKGLGDDVTSSKDATCEDIKETTVGQHDTTVAYLEEGQAISLMPKEILMEETEEKSSDAQEVVCISAQTESQDETAETEEKNEESIKEAYEETTKEVCDETILKKVESEEEVKAIETFKDEEQEKDQVDMSTEGQGEDNVTSSQVAALEEDLHEKNYQEEGKEPEFVETRESIEKNTEEIESSIETKENMEQQGLLHVITTDVCSSIETEPKEETMENEENIREEAIVNDDGQTDESESPLVKEVCEVSGSEKAESELNENEIVSKEDNQEKEHELKMPEEVQGGGDDVTSSDIKETTIGQHVSTDVDSEESKDDSALTKEILKEETEDKSIDAQEASEQYDHNGTKDQIEENPEESANIIFEQEKYTEEIIKPSVETDEKEQQEVCEETDLKKTVSEEGIKLPDSSDMYQNEKKIEILSKDEYQEKEQELNIPEKDQGEDEVICSQDTVAASEDVFFETRESMEEDNELISTNVETEEKVPQEELPHAITTDVFTSAQVESQEETTETEEKNKEPIERDDGQMEMPLIHSVKEVCDETSLEKVESEEGVKAIETFKDEDQEKDQVNLSAKGQGEDNVTTSQVAALEEDLQKKNYQEEGKEPEFFKTRESIEEDTEEIKSSVETIEKKEAAVNDDGQTEKSESSLVKEVHEVTGLEKAESELNEDETASKEENQEKEKDLKMSEEVQDGGDDVTSSHNASSEDIKETTIGQHATTVANIEERQEQTEITKEIFLEDLETVSEVQIPVVVPQSEDPNMKEECLTTATHVDEEKGTETKEISSEEKTEQTTEIGGNDSFYGKEDVTQENQPNSTEDCSEISKDVILTKEIEQVPLETQKENGTDDLKEQIVEEDSKSTELQDKSTEDQKAHVISYSDASEIDESPKQALESVCDVQTPEVVADSEDSKVKEESIVSATTEYTDENNGEEEHEVRANETSSAEKFELHGELKPTSELVIEEDQVKETKPQPEQSDITSENIMENVILTEKDLADGKTTTSNEKELADEVSSELGQPKGQIVEEIQAGPTETISEIIEDEITKKDENLSHDSIEDLNDTTTKEEKIFQDERTWEIEPVEEQNDGLDEASMEKSTDLDETTEVEHQEDSVPSSSLGTSTEDTPNSEKEKAENKILPIDPESVYDEQIPEVVPKSEDSNLKEDCLTSATTTYVDEEKETVTKEISSDEKTEQTTEIGEDGSLYEQGDMKEDVTQENQLNTTEDCNEMSKDVILTEEVPLNIQKEKETDDLKEQIVEEDSHSTELQEKSTEDQKEMAHVISYSDPTPVGVSEVTTDEISNEETTESKQVAEHLSISSRDAVLIKENLEVHGGLNPTFESVIEEDQVKETKPEPEQSDITSENIIKHTSEKDLADEKRDMEEDVTLAPENQIDNTENQNETIKNVILTDEVAVETEKEEEKNEVNEHVSEEDICPTELDKTSTSNQKDLPDEIEHSKPIPAGNNEVKEVKAESPTEPENIQSAEAPDLEFEKKEKDDELISKIQTPETTLKMEMKEEHLEATNDTCQTLVDGSLSEKKLVSVVPPEELASSTVEEQTNELVLEKDKTKVEHSSISNKDQNLEFTEEEFPKILVTEEKTLEEDANKEKETLSESQADDLTKTTSDSISSPTEQGIEVRSEESIGYADIHKPEEKPTEVFEIASEVAEIVPEGSKVSEILPGNVQEASHTMLLEKNYPETTTTIEKITPEVAVIDVQKHEKDFDYTPEAITVDAVSNAECSDIQSVRKKEVDENIERKIPTEKEPLELDAPVTPGTAATEDLEISQKHVTDDLIKISKIQPEIQTYEGSACTVDNQFSNKPHLDESIERKLLTDDLKATKASGTESQYSSEASGEEKKMDDEKEKSQTAEPAKILLTDMMHEQTKGDSEVAENLIEKRETALTKDQQVDKEETGEKGTKTDEENEEEDEEDNQMIDAPVMVEASKDIEVKTPKKSHNILSGVGSKVKHSIAKVKKAITGKSSPSKPPSPKEKDQVIT